MLQRSVVILIIILVFCIHLVGQDLVPTPTTDAQSLNMLRLPPNTSMSVPSPRQDFQAITPQNAEDVQLLGVIPFTSYKFSQGVSANSQYVLGIIHTEYPESYQLNRINLDTFESQPIFTHRDRIYSPVLSPDNSKIALYTKKDYVATFHLIELSSGEVLTSWTTIIYEYLVVFNVAFSSDGTMLSYPGGILDVETGNIRVELKEAGMSNFSPDNQRVAVQTIRAVYIYDVRDGKLILISDYFLHYFTSSYEPPLYSNDGRLILMTLYEDILIIDAQTGETRFTIFDRSPGDIYQHRYGFASASTLTFDSQYLLKIYSISYDPNFGVDVINTVTGEQQGSYRTESYIFAVSPNGKLLAMNNPLQLFDLTTGEIFVIDRDIEVEQLAFSPDGTLLLASTDFYPYQTNALVFGIPTKNRPTIAFIPSVANAPTR